MDFRFSDADQAFRADLRTFLDDEIPDWWHDTADPRSAADNPEHWRFTKHFQKRLSDKGWLTLSWPKEHGGGGAGYIRQALFAETWPTSAHPSTTRASTAWAPPS